MRRAAAVLTIVVGLVAWWGVPAAWAAGQQYYMRTGETWIMLVDVVQSGNAVVGKLYFDYVDGSLPYAKVATKTVQFYGSDHNGTLVLDFAGNTVFGSMRPSTFDVQITSQGGQVEKLQLSRTTDNDYNLAVERFEFKVGQEDFNQRLLDDVSSAASAVQSDLATIAHPGNIGFNESVVHGDVTTVRGDLGTLRGDMVSLQSDVSAGTGYICTDVQNVRSDAQSAFSDAQYVLSDARSSVGPDIAKDEQAMIEAPGLWALYWQAYWRARHASLVPHTSIPSLAYARQLGAKVIASIVAQINSDIDQANSYVAQAYGTANSVTEQYHCGTPLAVPQLQHVTAAWLVS